ncbi:SDR family NAD(P)-dependent oxidoreductase [Pseudactinotalea terrae]|uniref:SDR family NAD(P)-dependent oxidoreductase n=1 Tax=Pseudactinotalea terrae TaxID=1743262 RepID=UPI0012E1F635|nr:SDR family oxidoreductase [Pseudactinotalea terrae]
MPAEDLAVVVGAAQGIGEAIARRLARGRQLVVADLNGDGAASLAADLTAHGHACRSLQVDIGDPGSVAALVEATAGAGQVAIAAGIFAASPSMDVTPDELHRILAVNLVGVYDVARSYARTMAARGGGAICAVGSIAARMPRMRQAAYSASKAGMRQALRVLGMEVLPLGVRITLVAPGPTATPMMQDLAGDHHGIPLATGDLAAMRPRIPDGRVGTPDDVAAAVQFLLSADAAHVALHDLYVDGGESLGM